MQDKRHAPSPERYEYREILTGRNGSRTAESVAALVWFPVKQTSRNISSVWRFKTWPVM